MVLIDKAPSLHQQSPYPLLLSHIRVAELMTDNLYARMSNVGDSHPRLPQITSLGSGAAVAIQAVLS